MNKPKPPMLRALVLGVGLALPLSAFAMPGYWTNSDGQSWNSTYATGHCWRTPGWQKGDANAQCGAYLMPKPKPVATPAPAPAPAPAPKIITLNAVASGKAYMAWNKAKVTPAQAAKLDRELKSIKMADIKDIKITGYTDRTGPKAYNMKLSKERADNVAKYIENHYNIPADKIQTIGMGPADPVVSCPGTKLTPQLIKCLAPNRRVTVEVDMKVTKTVPAN